MTDQPTTPTVDTDELRGLLAEASGFARSDPDLYGRITAALARPVPAAPAEPGATEVERRPLGTIIHPENAAFTLDRVAWGGYEPVRVEGGDLVGAPRSFRYLQGAMQMSEAVAKAMLAALAAPPAPADEGEAEGVERLIRRYEDRIHEAVTEPTQVPWAIYTAVIADLRELAAASPAPAVPEERDEGVPERAWFPCFLEEYGGDGHELLEICSTCRQPINWRREHNRPPEDGHVVALAARPAPVTARTVMEGAVTRQAQLDAEVAPVTATPVEEEA